jgi:hypothetical protein
MLVARAEVSAADNKGSTESNCVHILAIDAIEANGYRGATHGEHSGENPPKEPADLAAELADNRADQIAITPA